VRLIATAFHFSMRSLTACDPHSCASRCINRGPCAARSQRGAPLIEKELLDPENPALPSRNLSTRRAKSSIFLTCIRLPGATYCTANYF
jgi:hypothetical protein